MSDPTDTPPPGPPPPPPLPQPAAPSEQPEGNPWEQRAKLGFFEALLENVKLFVLSPGEAFDRTRRTGDLGSPLLYAVLVSWAGILVAQLWSVATSSTLMSMMPAEYRHQMGPLMATSAMQIVFVVFLAPVVTAIFLFIFAGILHLSVLLVGASSDSDAGFEGTFRVVCYAMTADVALVVPFVGQLLATIWFLVLMVIGIARLHRTTDGRAVAAVLIPVALACLCCVLGFVMFAGMIMAAIAGQQ